MIFLDVTNRGHSLGRWVSPRVRFIYGKRGGRTFPDARGSPVSHSTSRRDRGLNQGSVAWTGFLKFILAKSRRRDNMLFTVNYVLL